MWRFEELFVVTIAFFVQLLHSSGGQNPIGPFIEGFVSGLSSAITPRHDTDVPLEFGRNVSIRSVPFQIALYKDNYFICSGAIISTSWALTAADCVYGGGNFGIRAGSSSNSEGGEIRHVIAVVINGGYNAISKENDVAMLRVHEPFEWSRHVRPVNLAGPRLTLPEKLMVTGWGSFDDHLSDYVYKLRAVEVTLISHDTCSYAYRNKVSVSEVMLCATTKEKDACKSDTGSPMTYKGVLFGIQSLGAGCERIDLPGIFTNVRRQLRWIKTVEKRFR